MKTVLIPELNAPALAYDRQRDINKDLDAFVIRHHRVCITEEECKKLLGGKMMNENARSFCCDGETAEVMPQTIPTVIELQAEGIDISKAALETVQVIRMMLFGIGHADRESKNEPQNARDALCYQNELMGRVYNELSAIARDLGCHEVRR